ncbi:MAG: HAD family hydrolase [Myxococcales bacterium]|nr:HAD family hydrolase [Myxococcales bacterium]
MSTILARILEKIERVRQQGRDPLIVLDLDGTIYNNAPRTLRILQEFAHQHAYEHPRLLNRIEQLAARDILYGVSDTLRSVGIDDEENLRQIQNFWFERFFTNTYLLHDLPTEGAVEFVRRVYEAEAIPAYLTGRDAPNMLLGTIQTLQRDGFPIGTVDTRIILKPDFQTRDSDYKQSVVDHLRQAGEVVAVFDNEPGLCNLFQRAFPEAVVVRLEMPHAPNPEALLSDVIQIPHFAHLLRGQA